MIDFSDVSEFAKGSYRPIVVAAATVLCASGLLSVTKLINGLLDSVVSVFVAGGEGNSAKTTQQLSRFIALAFLVLAWPPAFSSLSNLAPYSIVYEPSSSMFRDRGEWYPAIGCFYLDANASPRDVSQFVWNNVEILDEERTRYYRDLIGERLTPWFFAQSMLVILLLSLIGYVIYPSIREFRIKALMLCLAAIMYLSYTAFFDAENAVMDRYFALLDAHYTGVPVNMRANSPCIDTLRASFPKEIESTGRIVRLSLRPPDLSGLVPR